MTKVQLDDRWGRPSGLWSENGELIVEGVDMEKTKAMIKENILKMNAGPMPHYCKTQVGGRAEKQKAQIMDPISTFLMFMLATMMVMIWTRFK